MNYDEEFFIKFQIFSFINQNFRLIIVKTNFLLSAYSTAIQPGAYRGPI